MRVQMTNLQANEIAHGGTSISAPGDITPSSPNPPEPSPSPGYHTLGPVTVVCDSDPLAAWQRPGVFTDWLGGTTSVHFNSAPPP